MDSDQPPLFKIGQVIRIRKFNPKTHTRAPRYIRGCTGKVRAHYGAHVFPDEHAKNARKIPAHLYSVRFDSKELWGQSDGKQGDTVLVDVFEPYLRNR